MAEPKRSCNARRQPHDFVIRRSRPFSKLCGSVLRMARRNRDTKAIDNTVARNRLRSSLFHWMAKRHDDIVERWDGEKIDWVTFCIEMAELGLTDLTGKPATEKTARQTWFRARAAVAKKRKSKAAAPPPRVNPSRIEKDWRPAAAPAPPVTGQSVALRPSTPLPLGQSLAPSRSYSESLDELRGIRKIQCEAVEELDAEAKIARVRRLMSGR